MTDRYADIRAALDYSKQFRENCLVAFNSADIRALLAERDAFADALMAIEGMYEYDMPVGEAAMALYEASNIARAALAQEQGGSDA